MPRRLVGRVTGVEGVEVAQYACISPIFTMTIHLLMRLGASVSNLAGPRWGLAAPTSASYEVGFVAALAAAGSSDAGAACG